VSLDDNSVDAAAGLALWKWGSRNGSGTRVESPGPEPGTRRKARLAVAEEIDRNGEDGPSAAAAVGERNVDHG